MLKVGCGVKQKRVGNRWGLFVFSDSSRRYRACYRYRLERRKDSAFFHPPSQTAHSHLFRN
ncbi:MAG TPA: hypothetical protein DEB39_04515 [Planctomycetaceae bacterium]|nr:hypothetical protein [Planctomycetaceae bacterium]